LVGAYATESETHAILFEDPAVVEAVMVPNLVDGGMDPAEFIADALDEAPDVDAVAIGRPSL
jgi:hypothetical protein